MRARNDNNYFRFASIQRLDLIIASLTGQTLPTAEGATLDDVKDSIDNNTKAVALLVKELRGSNNGDSATPEPEAAAAVPVKETAPTKAD